MNHQVVSEDAFGIPQNIVEFHVKKYETLDAEGEIIRSFNGLQKCRDMWYWLVVWNINDLFSH